MHQFHDLVVGFNATGINSLLMSFYMLYVVQILLYQAISRDHNHNNYHQDLKLLWFILLRPISLLKNIKISKFISPKTISSLEIIIKDYIIITALSSFSITLFITNQSEANLMLPDKN